MSRAPGSVYRRNGAWAWRLSYRDPAGRRVWHGRQGYASRADAIEAMTIARAAMIRGGAAYAPQVTVGDYLRAWVEGYCRSGRVKATTQATTRAHIEAYLVPHLGDVRLGDLDHDRVARFYGDLLADGRRGVNGAGGLSPKTVRNIAGTLHRALGDAVKRGQLGRNAAAGVDLPRWDRRDLTVWDHGEVARFLATADAVGDPLRAVWRLIATTGLRRGEVLGLRWCDVDLVDGTVTITQARVSDGHRTHITTPKTRAGRRTIAIDSGTVIALAQLLNAQTATADRFEAMPPELVACDAGNLPLSPDGLTDRFHTATRRAGLRRCRLHDLRHAAATIALGHSVPVHIVAGRLGHANPATTLAIYAAWLPAADRLAATAYGSALDDAIATARRAPDAHQLDETVPDSPSRGDTRHHSNRTKPNIGAGDGTRGHAREVPPLGFEPVSPKRRGRRSRAD